MSVLVLGLVETRSVGCLADRLLVAVLFLVTWLYAARAFSACKQAFRHTGTEADLPNASSAYLPVMVVVLLVLVLVLFVLCSLCLPASQPVALHCANHVK